MGKPRVSMEEVPTVDKKGDSKDCWNWKTVFAHQLCVAYGVKDDSEGSSEKNLIE